MKQVFYTIFLASITILIAVSLITYPEQALQASIEGLDIWWKTVFPALLPFFITAELLISFGVVSFLGVLFEPFMRPIFNVPGAGGFAWVMGMASGYPSGAKMTVQLREKKQLTRIEAERLISFTNASSPLFIFGAVSVGFFHDANLGILIAISHYVGNAFVGLCMRFYKRSQSPLRREDVSTDPLIVKAFKKMHHTRLSDDRPFGQILGDAVVNSVKTLVMVGGFIILFSVFTNLIYLLGITPFFSILFQYILKVLLLPIDLALPFISGLFEVTMGAQLISEVSTDSLLPQLILVSFILGFNGFSIQAQVASIIAKTDIRFAPYFFSRFLHGFFASVLVILLFKPLYVNRKDDTATVLPTIGQLESNFSDVSTIILLELQHIGPLITITFVFITLTLMYSKKGNHTL